MCTTNAERAPQGGSVETRMARRWSAAHAERRRCPGGSRSGRGTPPALHIRTQPTTSSISCDRRGVQWGVSATASCSNVCGRFHRYPMPSRAWSGGTWLCLRQPSTERPLCRPFETTKADMVALSACGVNELHSWWRSLTTQNGHMLLSVEPSGPGRSCVMYWMWTGSVAVVLAFTGAHSLKYITE